MDPPNDDSRTFPLSKNTLEALTRGMWGVVNEGGTGAGAQSPGLDIAGKTGTAQVVSVGLKESARKQEFRNNAWFVGYAPSENPAIVVAVLVMQGEHSTVAVPVARDVIKAYYDRKLAKQPVLEQTRLHVLSRATIPAGGGPNASGSER
jgi:penicillin-binding protein 2